VVEISQLEAAISIRHLRIGISINFRRLVSSARFLASDCVQNRQKHFITFASDKYLMDFLREVG
jgi:hypothetical protein